MLLFAPGLFAQRVLNLEDALSIARRESYLIKSADFNLLRSEKSLEATKLGLRTSVDMEFDVPSYSRNLTSYFNETSQKNEFYEVGSTRYESRLSIRQPIVFSNGRFSVTGQLFGRNQFSQRFPSSDDFYSNVVLSLNQPLFTFNTQKADLERAELNLEVTQKNYSRTEADIVYSVTEAFFNLYKAKKNFEITQEKVRQTDVSYETALNKFKAGLIAEVDALQLEVELASAKNDLLNTERHYNEAKDNFKLLIGLDLSENIDIIAQIEYSPVRVERDEAVAYALKNRPELFSSEAEIRLSELQMDEIDARNNIKAELNLNYGINKVDTSFGSVFNNFLQNRSVVFTVSVPVWDWGRNSREVESAEAGLRLSRLTYDNQKQNIINEITQLINRIESAKARVEVLSRSVEVADKSFNISMERFKSGNITSFDLSQMQIKLTDAKINSLTALIDYKLAVADLNRRTLHKFD